MNPSFSQLARAGDCFTLLLLFKPFLEKQAFQWYGSKGRFYSLGAYDIEWEWIGPVQNYVYGWPNVIISLFRKVWHVGGMTEKGHILVNLRQI